MSVQVLLPSALGEVTGGARHVDLDLPTGATVADVVAALGERFPRLAARLCDEAGVLRRFVNVYVDGSDVRGEGGLATGVADGAVVHVLPSIAGG
jgi:molybdopterin converting factor small subunit